MDFPFPKDIAIDAVTEQLISDANALARQVNERRPLPAEVVKNIQKELLGEQVYNSNAIEGNTLTLRETKGILESGNIVDVGQKREATEAINLGKAVAEVQQIVANRRSWSDVTKLQSIHKILLTNIDDHAAGVIRSVRVMITGAKYQPPNPLKVEDLLEKFSVALAESVELEPVILATWAHWAIARIHPFVDGNGRMARLWQDLILFGNRLTAAVIRQTDRTEYYASLGSADEDDFNPLIQLVTRSLSKTLQIYINAQREVDELKDWAADIVGETNARIDDQRKLEYLRWARQMDSVRDAFERCATQVTNASDGTVEIQVRDFDIIDQPTWETLRSGDRASKTWFFWVNFRRLDTRIQYCFYFGRHFFSAADREFSGIGPSTCLLVSEQDGEGTPVRLGEIDAGKVTLRELLVVEDKMARKRFDISEGKETYDLEVDEVQVAREFVQEVLLSRIG